MTPFTRLEGIAAPLPVANIDTDMLFPARFLKTTSRRGLGRALLHSQRFDEAGEKRPDFVLNRAPWDKAEILITLGNLGTGSSREHAPWALLDFGVRCLIAPSFADIFRGNCLKNGILPVTLTLEQVRGLLDETARPETARLSVDLTRQEIGSALGSIPFEIEPEARSRLLLGLDDIGETLGRAAEIARFEADATGVRAWIGPIGPFDRV
jgi:3-isopropylmalate/(R)-2-methylmalate dehydratase small subunit